MRIEYNVPCPMVSDPRIRKEFIPLYDQIFHYMHSDEKELVLKCDTPKEFRSNLNGPRGKYGKFIISISTKNKEVRLISYEKIQT